MTFESPEQTNPKERQWQETLAALDRVVDKRGKHIDLAIKETVAALKCMGFETEASCEGHLERKLKAPWVGVSLMPNELKAQIEEHFHYLRQSGDSRAAEDFSKEVRGKKLQEAVRLMELLEEFYKESSVPFERRLVLRFYPDSIRLQNQGAEAQEAFPVEVQRQKLAQFRQEMEAFTEFLKRKFLP